MQVEGSYTSMFRNVGIDVLPRQGEPMVRDLPRSIRSFALHDLNFVMTSTTGTSVGSTMTGLQ